MARWWQRHPARWEQELSALRDTGIDFAEDPTEAAKGVKHLRIRREHEGRTITLEARYPAEFPFFPPIVWSRDVRFARHQTPESGHLCLLGENDWKPASDTLAWLLTEQWNSVLVSQPGPARDASVETRQAEPLTAYIDTEPQSFVGFPEFDQVALPAHGTFRFALESLHPLRGTVLSLHADDGTELPFPGARTEGEHGGAPVMPGRWVKLDERPRGGSPQAYYDDAAAAHPPLRTPSWQTFTGSVNGRIDVLAVLFPDELTWQQEGGNVIVASKTQVQPASGPRTSVQTRIHRAELESHRLYALRDPGAPALKPATACVVGLGSIGSPVAKLLAQAGLGGINLIDFDTLTAGNAIRWETGRSQAGRPKVNAMVDLIVANFPFTRVAGIVRKVGDAHYAGMIDETRVHDILFRGVDCVVDAAASDGLSHYLCAQAEALGRRHVWLYATNGGWGGFVGAYDGDRACPCWCCHMFYKLDGTIPPLIAAPESEGVHPPQCLDPTFTGAQVDLMEVSLMATRLVADRCRTARGGQTAHRYPWTFATVALRDSSGEPIPPLWTTYALPPHASCPYH